MENKRILKILFYSITIILVLFGTIQIFYYDFISIFPHVLNNLYNLQKTTQKTALILQVFWCLLYIINFIIEENYSEFFWPLLLFPIIFFTIIS